MVSRCLRACLNPRNFPTRSSPLPQRRNRVRMTRTSPQNEVRVCPSKSTKLSLLAVFHNSSLNPPQRPRSSARNYMTRFPPSPLSCTQPQRSMRLREDSSSRTRSSSSGSSAASLSSSTRRSRQTLRDTGRIRGMPPVAASRASTSSIFATGSRLRAFKRVSRLAWTDRAGL